MTKWAARPSTAQARPNLGRGQSSQVVPVHGLHTRLRHSPISLGPCRASPKARQLIVLLHRISLFFFPHIFGLSYMVGISLFGIPLFFGTCLLWVTYFSLIVPCSASPPCQGIGLDMAQLSGRAGMGPTPVMSCRVWVRPNDRVIVPRSLWPSILSTTCIQAH